MSYQLGPIAITGSTVNVSGSISVNSNNVQPYKVYAALLTQAGFDAPSASIVYNTLGDISWSYTSTGQYVGTLANAFTQGKTFLPPGDPSTPTYWGVYGLNDDLTDTGKFTALLVDTTSSVRLISISSPETPADGLLTSFPIEIKVYN